MVYDSDSGFVCEECNGVYQCELCGSNFQGDSPELAAHGVQFVKGEYAELTTICPTCREHITMVNDDDESEGYLMRCRLCMAWLRQDDEGQWVCPGCGTDFGDGQYRDPQA